MDVGLQHVEHRESQRVSGQRRNRSIEDDSMLYGQRHGDVHGYRLERQYDPERRARHDQRDPVCERIGDGPDQCERSLRSVIDRHKHRRERNRRQHHRGSAGGH